MKSKLYEKICFYVFNELINNELKLIYYNLPINQVLYNVLIDSSQYVYHTKSIP